MELMYCHNCNFRLNADDLASGVAIRTADDKLLCGKCKPLFEHTTSYLLTVPLPEEAQNTTRSMPMPTGMSDGSDESWSREKRIRVIVGAVALTIMVGAVVTIVLMARG